MDNSNRYVQLTDAGLGRLHAARRKYRRTVEDIIADRDTPSANTVKRTLRKGPVFVSTLERIWGYLQRCAEAKGETLPLLTEAGDYIFVEGAERESGESNESARPPEESPEMRGWISRQVPRPNRLFTGRREVLDHLHAALTGPHGGPLADPQALIGMGGIGKTQTAIAYIYAHRNDYARIFWVSAETVESLNDGLANIAEELGLAGAAPIGRNQALAKAHDWFRNQSNWLLILDNADAVDLLASHFPRHHTGHLLLTTQARNTVRWAAPLAVRKFGPEEGALLLLRRAGVVSMGQRLEDASPDSARAALELSRELDGLPLAINQAGAYLAEAGIGVGEYLARYRRQGLEFLDGSSDGDHRAVVVTFDLAVKQMTARSLYGPAAVDMLRLCAFLMPDAIPEALFATPDFEPYHDVCTAVCAYSLVARDPENQTLSLHRLVQKAAREALPAEEQRAWRERAVNVVSAATPDFEPADWPLCDLLLPHWRLCASYIADDAIKTTEAVYLLYQTGRYLRARALYEESETLLQRALTLAEQVYGPEHNTTADTQDELACLYREIDRPEAAEPLHLRALAITEKTIGLESPQVASRLHNMALFYGEQKEFAQAESLFLRSLAIREKHPGQDELLTAATLTQLAGVYREQGRLEAAEPYYQRALEVYEGVLEPEHVDIATASNNLGLLCVNLARYAEAESLFLRSLGINERLRGQDHPETGVVVWSLAWARWKQHRLSEADELFQRALRIYSKHFGEGHSRLTRLTAHYARFQEETGYRGEAL